MKPVTEYEDYRVYMQDYYTERKRVSSFSWREFTRASGFTSPTYLKLVCECKTRLSPQGAEKVGMAMELAGFELEYFKSMVTYCHAKTDQERKSAYETMLELASNNKVKVVDGDAFKYFESWVHPVVRELAPVMSGATPGDIAKRCCQVVSAAEIRESLDFMVRIGLLKKNGDNYVQADKHLKGMTSAVSVALRYMHREMAHFAEEAIIRFTPSERNFTGLTMGISAEDYKKILQELDVCRKKVAQIALNSRGTERVYRLNLQLFPLTWKEDNSDVR
ncbi:MULTISPECIES: TIGR02147 family protein [unclassified Fibrobacter]|uniref:TIGR02147 family protein n=1 Tax=unclassified Fibrobacter TaxID=2634177 RepID=UPI0009117E3C|nr:MULTISPECIES: TIGR02147 family protein [unclassified Fibrobacter]SHK42363.1 TIGR02147 family protein [Fibrobacter sp. UWB12]SIN85025.1 TIGR02147 family protein [Fibrobacter sp. UWB11]